ncbi:surface glycoprotein (TIGR04207 family), partial [Halarchaeum solikamskense]|uniref:surface glycoprotein n=1 Tax=Halarchaeum nitratireducens TaxID=489913 RepID=UPI001B3ABB9E
MSDNNSKLRAVLLSALMVLSVFGATVAFTGGAAASASTWSQVSSDDVETGQSSYSQDLVFTAGFDSNGTENATLDLSNYPDGITVTDATVSGSPDGITVANEDLNTSNDEFSFDLISTNQNGVSGDVTITLTMDTTGASATQGVSPTLSAAQSGSDTSFSFDVVEPATTTSTTTSSNDGGADHRAANADGTGEAPTDGVSEVYIFPGATVYKGEEDLTFAGGLGSSLTGVAGNAEGTILSPPVPQDQSEGRYTTDGESGSPGVTVNTPRVTSLDVNNQNGKDISGSSVSEQNARNLEVAADWNFQEAENLEITVEDSSGLEITGDVVEGSDTIKNADGEASWNLDLSDQDAGDYSITVEGTEDLDFGQASQTTSIALNTDDDIELDLGSSSVTQGSNVQYTIRGGVAGDVHHVVIDANDLRDSTSNRGATQVFRNVGDVNARGIITDDGNVYGPNEISELGSDESIDYLYAAVEIDDDTGVGVGSIDTQYLDDTSIDVDVYDAG